MKIAFISLLLIILSSNLFSQANNGTIKGKVIDSKTNEGVPFASMYVPGEPLPVLYPTRMEISKSKD